MVRLFRFQGVPGLAFPVLADVRGSFVYSPTMRTTRLNRFELKRLRRQRPWQRWLLVAGCLAVAAVAALPVVSGRTTARWYQLRAAELAIRTAQQADAESWAPEPLKIAQRALRLGQVEHRHQETRFFFLRDFARAEVLLHDAQTKGQRATEESLGKRRDARSATREAMARATEAVSRTAAFGEAMHLGRTDRSLLQQSKIGLTEARLLFERGEYALAIRRATIAAIQAEMVSNRAARVAARYSDTDLVRQWRKWIDETVAASRRSGQTAIIVNKEKHTLTLYAGGRPVRSYAAELGYNSAGNKSRSGDGATPEGRYRITNKKPVGHSTYHMALLLDYPNAEDRRRFERERRSGRIGRNVSMGSLIEIHGDGGRGKDWTRGCVALSNSEMEDLFARVDVGTPVTIVGGDGNGGTFTRLVETHRSSGAQTGLD